MDILYSWNFNVTAGYNNILLSSPVSVFRGNFIILTQNSGYIALYTAGNATYSDMAWNTSIWTNLVATSNWRFYLTPTTNFSVYQNSFNLYHSYNWVGLFNLSMIFLSSNISFIRIVNVTDCKLYLIWLIHKIFFFILKKFFFHFSQSFRFNFFKFWKYITKFNFFEF